MARPKLKEQTFPLTFRMKQSEFDKLDELVELYSDKVTSRGALIRSLILAEYDKVSGYPELKKALSVLKSAADEIKSITSDFDT